MMQEGRNKNGVGCPYAVALSDDEEHSEASHTTVQRGAMSCPAFESNCPFKEAKSAQDVKQTLAQMPKSHFEEQGDFYKIVQHLHQVHENPQIPEKVLAFASGIGGCPMQPFFKEQQEGGAERISFAKAMENFSLAASMAKLVEENDMSLDAASNPEEAEEAAAPMRRVSSSCSLSDALKTGTMTSHQKAENVHFVKNFIRGQIDRTLYAKLVWNLYQVYSVLEDELNQHAPQVFPTCHFPKELSRRQTLQEDVEFWHGDNYFQTPSPATQDYCDRILFLAKTQPLLLLAHSYTRYLGDLSGGKILARVARKALHLDKDGLAFYHFHQIKGAKQFKDNYRLALNSLNLDEQQIRQIVAEANVAFCLNMRMFQELDVLANIPGALVMSLEEALSYQVQGANNDDDNAFVVDEQVNDKCPFLLKKEQESPPKQAKNKGGRCPWPFIFAHDPVQGLWDWQTWVVIYLITMVIVHYQSTTSTV